MNLYPPSHRILHIRSKRRALSTKQAKGIHPVHPLVINQPTPFLSGIKETTIMKREACLANACFDIEVPLFVRAIESVILMYKSAKKIETQGNKHSNTLSLVTSISQCIASKENLLKA